jgi:bifunctional polynucleotide phosphatase/kinase
MPWVSGENFGYFVADVEDKITLSELASENDISFINGYYQVTTITEDVKKHKLLVLLKGQECFDDPAGCRKKLGLKPDADAKFKANINPSYTIFIQSTSGSRALKPGTKALFSVSLSDVPKGNNKTKAKPKAKAQESESEEEVSNKRATKAKGKRAKASSDEEEEVSNKRATKAKGKRAKASSDEEEEEKPQKKGKGKNKVIDLEAFKDQEIPEKKLRTFPIVTATHLAALSEAAGESLEDLGLDQFGKGFKPWAAGITFPEDYEPSDYDNLLEKADEETEDGEFSDPWCNILCAYLTAVHKTAFFKFFKESVSHLEGEDEKDESNTKPQKKNTAKPKKAASEEEEEEEKPKKKAKKEASDDEGETKAAPVKGKKVEGTAKAVGSYPYGLTWSNIEPTLMCLDSPSLPGSDKIVGFDMDSTLVVPKSGAKFPSGPADWKWWNAAVVPTLQKYHNAGFKLVVFTNQAGIEKGKQKPGDITTKILALSKDAGVPLQAFVAAATNHWRKPHRAMWDELIDNHNKGVEPDMSECIFVGDAAGRPKDWQPGAVKDFGCGDRKFGLNIGAQFMTPEEFFLGLKTPAPFKMDSLDPAKFLKSVAGAGNGFTGSSITKSSQEMIVFCARPASGKSTFVRNHLASYTWVNRDTLKTPAKCVKVAREALAGGKSVVIDNTCPDAGTRSEYIGIAKEFGVPVRCFMFDLPKEVSEHLNFFREGFTKGEVRRVPDVGFNMWTSKHKPPTTAEGFSEVCTVQFVPQFKSEADKKLFLEWTE